jgi:hypothetical protein
MALQLGDPRQARRGGETQEGDRGARASRPPPPQSFGCFCDSRVEYGNVLYTSEVD